MCAQDFLETFIVSLGAAVYCHLPGTVILTTPETLFMAQPCAPISIVSAFSLTTVGEKTQILVSRERRAVDDASAAYRIFTKIGEIVFDCISPLGIPETALRCEMIENAEEVIEITLKEARKALYYPLAPIVLIGAVRQLVRFPRQTQIEGIEVLVRGGDMCVACGEKIVAMTQRDGYYASLDIKGVMNAIAQHPECDRFKGDFLSDVRELMIRLFGEMG